MILCTECVSQHECVQCVAAVAPRVDRRTITCDLRTYRVCRRPFPNVIIVHTVRTVHMIQYSMYNTEMAARAQLYIKKKEQEENS